MSSKSATRALERAEALESALFALNHRCKRKAGSLCATKALGGHSSRERSPTKHALYRKPTQLASPLQDHTFWFPSIDWNFSDVAERNDSDSTDNVRLFVTWKGPQEPGSKDADPSEDDLPSTFSKCFIRTPSTEWKSSRLDHLSSSCSLDPPSRRATRKGGKKRRRLQENHGLVRSRCFLSHLSSQANLSQLVKY